MCACEIYRIGSAQFSQLRPQHVLSTSNPLGRLLKYPPPQQTFAVSIVVCTYFLSTIDKRLPYVCSKTTQIVNFTTTLPPNTKEQITSSTLREKVKEIQSVIVTVAKGGTVWRVLIGGAVRRKLDISLQHDTMLKMQSNLNLSDTQTLETVKVVREGAGSMTAIQSNLNGALSLIGRTLEIFFKFSLELWLVYKSQAITFIYRSEQGINSIQFAIATGLNYSCVNDPFLAGDINLPILQIIPPPNYT